MSDSETDNCLAYEVLRRPDEWIGTPSAQSLRSLLSGAVWSLELSKVDVSFWRIGGALFEETFVNELKERHGMATLSCLWAEVIDGHFLSGREGLAHLLEEALNWHRKHGVSDGPCDSVINYTPGEFWPLLFKRPAMYLGGSTGWDLYCALIGMTRGSDWLGIPRLPGAEGLLTRISKWYSAAYAAFRMEPDSQRLLSRIDPTSLDLQR